VSAYRLLRRALSTLIAGALSLAPALGGEILFDQRAPSAALGRDIAYTLYQPSAAPEPGRRWPVLYLFHGLNGTERDWAEAGRAKETLDRLIEARRIEPLLVVMPMAGNGWYVDNPDPGGAGRLAEAFTADLVNHVDRSHPTAACRAGRALGGLSMGGYGALLYAMDHPGRFAAAFSLSGSVFQPMPDEPEARAARRTSMFNNAFGTPFDWRRFNRWSLLPRVPAYAADRNRPPLYLAIGEDDFPGLKRGNVLFRRALAEAGVEVPLRVDPGGHVWELWAAQLEPALIWLGGHLRPGC
jgi:enterochelin esterase family protein